MRLAGDRARSPAARTIAAGPAAVVAPSGLHHTGGVVLVFIVITIHQRNTALLVAGCLFMAMLDGTDIIVS
jgi:hypothetical protein